MSKPHKHAELIKAWADGAKIERKEGTKWVDFDEEHEYWAEGVEYRIKENLDE